MDSRVSQWFEPSVAVPARRMSARQTDMLLAMTDALLRQSDGNGGSHAETLAAISSLIHAATHDALTGLPSRGVLLDRLERELARRDAGASPLAVLFIDLDNFKLVNDSLGHDSGDELLREVARRIVGCVAPGDTVSRFGGDELVVLHLHACDGSEDALSARLLAAVEDPVHIGGREVVTTASIGIATGMRGAHQAEQVLRDADTALYAAKSRGRNRAERFNDDLHARVSRRMRVETDLRNALRESQLYVQYQPQVSLTNGQVLGVEALARWRHPEFGAMSPAEFIPVAEESGLIVELGRQVLRASCRQLVEWNSRPGRQVSMTVNVSPRQLEEPDFVAELERLLSETGVDPASLCVELTESSLMSREADLAGVLHTIRQVGVYAAIDDFGTEHSSLSRLRELPVEVLKIDRSFISGLPAKPGDMAIVSSILSLAYAMGKHVIAEGVERIEQALVLADMGCTVAQGYLFSPAVDAALIGPMLERALWQPSLHRAASRSAAHGASGRRRAHRTFIEEFLDHIGAPMGAKPGAF